MNLAALTLDDLTDLNLTLSQVIDAGRVLDDAGLAPLFDLTAPGGVVIRTSWQPAVGDAEVCVVSDQLPVRSGSAPPIAPPPSRAPLVEGPFSDVERARIRELQGQGLDARTIAQALGRRPGSVAMLLKPPVSHEYKRRPAPQTTNTGLPWLAEDDELAVGMRASGASARDIAIALHRPLSAVQARLKRVLADRIAAHREGAPGAPAVASTEWTAEEDERLVEATAREMVRSECSRTAAAAVAAKQVGRPVNGAQYRAKGALRDRIEARYRVLWEARPTREIPAGPPAAAQVRTQAASEGPEDAEGATSQPDDASDPAVAGAGSSLPTGGRATQVDGTLLVSSVPLWLRELRAHLDGLGYPEPFDPPIDLELVERHQRGEKLGLIAADLGIDSALLKRRYIALLPVTGIEPQARLVAELRLRAEGRPA